MGTIGISGRADLSPVYAGIFHWLQHLRAGLAASNAQAREEAMDHPPRATVVDPLRMESMEMLDYKRFGHPWRPWNTAIFSRRSPRTLYGMTY